MVSAPSLVYGYVRSSVDRPEFVKNCIEQIGQWCAREGLVLGGTFTDIGAPLDTEDRVGFCGLLQALVLNDSTAAVVLDSSHLSPRTDVVVTLIRKIVRTGSTLRVIEGDVPVELEKYFGHAKRTN